MRELGCRDIDKLSPPQLHKIHRPRRSHPRSPRVPTRLAGRLYTISPRTSFSAQFFGFSEVCEQAGAAYLPLFAPLLPHDIARLD